MPKQVSPETRQKISESLKLYHEIRKAPSPTQQRMNMFAEAFKEASNVDAPVRNYGGIGVELEEAPTRTQTQDNAPQEKK